LFFSDKIGLFITAQLRDS